jgi:hypothetical protein
MLQIKGMLLPQNIKYNRGQRGALRDSLKK